MTEPSISEFLVAFADNRPDSVFTRAKAAKIEEQGWRVWLMTMFPFWFGESFSDEHAQYWDLHWQIVHEIKRNLALPKEKRTPIAEHRLVRLLLLGRGLGKCIDENTDISMADGTRCRIADVAIGDRIHAYDEKRQRITTDVVTNKWHSGSKPCITVTTRTNKQITLTKEHRVLTFNGWRQAGELTVGDRIASPRRKPVEREDTTHCNEEVRLLAYFLAEGNTTVSPRAGGGVSLASRITTFDPEIQNDVMLCANALGFTAKESRRGTLNVRGARTWLREIGLAGKRATQKRIPAWVFRLRPSQVWQFVSAFIDTDGWIGNNGKIGITLANEAMVRDLQDLLLRVGIISRIYFRANAHANAWELLFDQYGSFTQCNSFTLRLKGDKLKKWASRPRYSLFDTYPYHIWRTLPHGVGYELQRKGIAVGHKYDITRQKLQRALAYYAHELWRRLEDADVYWDVIESITDAGVRNTYDIEVQSHHNFLANGLVTHNSATAEAARIMRGAILGSGYSLVISETDDQAQEHLGNARLLIEHPDSTLTHYYPDMAIAADADALKGMPTADRKEMFITKSGYIFRAKGLTAKMRGLRVGVYRPDDILFDDIDDVLDSLAVSQSKLKLISASIIPVQAREGYTTIDFAQNVIAEHSVVNQIYTGKADALAERTVIGPAPAFRILDIDSYFDADGRHRHKILDTSQPSWDGLNIARAQKFLNDSGLEVFMAEYQNEFSQFRSGKVIPEFSEKAQFITWSDFEDMFGTRSIPAHWKRIAGLDVGYSEGTHPHWSAWNFIATAAENSPMPGTLFVYASRSFKGVSIDDQADRIKADLGAQEIGLIRQWLMSHEKTGEMMTLRNKHKLPFGKFPFYKSDDGVAPWRHLSRCDQTEPHPFVDDEQFDGVWRLGRPNLFFIVDDEQLTRPVDDRGMRLLREQVSSWEYVPVKVTDSGQTAQKPSKINDDHCDCLKSCLALFGPRATVLTETEVKQRAMAETFRDVPVVDNKANVLMGQQLWSMKYDQTRKEKKRDPMKFR